jgi:uncharacterized damage-inducible protein DinB
MTDVSATIGQPANRERADLLETLAKHRHFLRLTCSGMSDEQAALHPTASELCLGGIVKHVADVERGWIRFILEGPSAMRQPTDTAGMAAWLGRFQMAPEETLSGLLEVYADVAARTAEVIETVPDLDASHRLPDAPWFESGASWSARRVLLHIIAETAQHAGHADIIRETIDGAKSMG